MRPYFTVTLAFIATHADWSKVPLLPGPTALPRITAPRAEVLEFIRIALADPRAELEPESASNILDGWAVDSIFLHTATPEAIRAACGGNAAATMAILHHLEILRPQRRPLTQPRSEPARTPAGKVCTLRLVLLTCACSCNRACRFVVTSK